MSEYQFYEFRALDRPLTAKEMEALRSLSTRAEITPNSFANEYHYGDFGGEPLKMMQKYFDAHLYLANWGTRRFMVQLPRGVIDPRLLAAYEAGDEHAESGLVVHAKGGDDVVLEFVLREEEGGGWVDEDEGGDWLNALTPVREALLGGDLRSLYIGWLAGVQGQVDVDDGDDEWDDGSDEDDGDDKNEKDDARPEPPVPAGLGKLSAAHKAVAEFLKVDKDLLTAAAGASAGETPAGPSRDELLAWVGRLPGRDKDEWLVRVMEGDAGSAGRELLGRRREAEAAGRPAGRRPRRYAGRGRWGSWSPPPGGNPPFERRPNRPSGRGTRPARSGRPPRPGKSTWTGWPAGRASCGSGSSRSSPSSRPSTTRRWTY